MLRNYLIIAWRNLWNNKLFSIINILGLAIGMTVFLIIMLYVNHEMSYDKFWKNSGNIYRVNQSFFVDEIFQYETTSPAWDIGFAIQSELPEVINTTRFDNYLSQEVYGQYIDPSGTISEIRTKNAYLADSNFFKIFDIPFLRGDPQTAFRKPGRVIISEKIADQLFGYRWRFAEPGNAFDPLGKQLVFIGSWGSENLEIFGVMEKIPSNSHLGCEIIYSGKWLYETNKIGRAVKTYIEVRSDTDIKELQKKINRLDYYHKQEYEQKGKRTECTLFSVERIHLHSDFRGELKPGGNLILLRALLLISFVILILAWINYINLSITKSMEWTKEIGLRKVVGASRKQLFMQSMLYTGTITFFSVIFTVTMLQLLMPLFNELINKELSLAFIINGKPIVIAFFLCLMILFVVSTFCSGFYPAVIISSLKPITCIRIKAVRFGSLMSLNLRKVLVLGQLAITMVLLTGTLTIFLQTNYMMSSPLGFEKDQILVLENNIQYDSTYQTNFEFLKNELNSSTLIAKISSSSDIPGTNNHFWSYKRQESDDFYLYSIITADPDFFECFDLQLVAGRNFNYGNLSDQEAVVISESALRKFGFEDPDDALGNTIRDDLHAKNVRTIIGVVKDYHQLGLAKAYLPIIFLPTNWFFYGDMENKTYMGFINRYISIKISSTNENIRASEVVSEIKDIWKTCFPFQPFYFYFLDDQYNAQYQSEVLTRKLLSYFSSTAIVIACLGLFGLSYYNNQQRTKEIGIRKTMGATVYGLFMLLSKGTIKLVLIAFVVSLPLSYMLLKNWLQGFAFRIEITPLLFVIPAFVVMCITFFTVGFQTIKTALANPVNALRYE